MIKVNDKWLRIALICIPSAIFLFNFLVSGANTLQANLIYILTVILACEGSRFLTYRSRYWFAEPHRRIKRLLSVFVLGVPMVSVFFVISKILRNYFAYGTEGVQLSTGFTLRMNTSSVEFGLISSSVFHALFTFIFLFGVFELAFHFAKLRFSEKERDRLEKEKLQAELQQLKGIVNPHFLFNNLNSLSSLITENPVQAEAFLDELTKVFRYLLRNNDVELTTLAQELQFMESYHHLLQTRYGSAISLRINVDSHCRLCLMPPLTLQLLIENAVKHNRVHKSTPLQIEIFNEGPDKLIVRNNLSARERSVESTGIGLRSINSRYGLLNEAPPVIQKTEDHFSVIIPLIQGGAAAAVNDLKAEALSFSQSSPVS